MSILAVSSWVVGILFIRFLPLPIFSSVVSTSSFRISDLTLKKTDLTLKSLSILNLFSHSDRKGEFHSSTCDIIFPVSFAEAVFSPMFDFSSFTENHTAKVYVHVSLWILHSVPLVCGSFFWMLVACCFIMALSYNLRSGIVILQHCFFCLGLLLLLSLLYFHINFRIVFFF